MTDDWIRLCTLLDDDPELVTAVGRAAVNPDAGDPWTVLIDTLDDGGALAYLERDDFGGGLADGLAGVPRVFRCGADLAGVADIDDLDAAIVEADRLLAPHGLRIVYLAEEPDAYPLVVVPAAHAEEIVARAADLGRRARLFG